MQPDKVVIHVVERDGVGVVLDLLAERVREPGEPAHMHPHGEVLALDVGRGDVLRVGATLDLDLAGSGAFGGAVAARRTRRGAVDLHELGKVHISPEGALDGFQIGPVTVACRLHAIGKAGGHVVHEPLGAFAVPAADEVAHHELAIGVERHPRPGVPGALGDLLRACDVLHLGVDEAPDLIDLDPLRLHAPNVLAMVGHADLAGIDQELRHRVLADTRKAGDSPDRRALTEEVQDAGAIGGGELVHALHHNDPYA